MCFLNRLMDKDLEYIVELLTEKEKEKVRVFALGLMAANEVQREGATA